MRDSVSLRKAVEAARRRHELMAEDRTYRDGRIGDDELTGLLEVAYPTPHVQHN